GAQSPSLAVPLPRIAQLVDVPAAEQDGDAARAVICHRRDRAWRGRKTSAHGPGPRVVELPRIAETTDAVPAAEHDGAGTRAVITHRVTFPTRGSRPGGAELGSGSVARRKRSRPEGSVPLPEIRQLVLPAAVILAAEQDHGSTREVVGHGVVVAWR